MTLPSLFIRNSSKILLQRRVCQLQLPILLGSNRDVTRTTICSTSPQSTPRRTLAQLSSSKSARNTTSTSSSSRSASSALPTQSNSRQASSTTTATMPSSAEHTMLTSGANDPVWVHKQPFSAFPSFPALTKDLVTDVCVIGAGIAGIHVAYELVRRGKNVVMLEARNVLSGESGRTSGHLNNDLDDGYLGIAQKFGEDGARVAAESHGWARDHVGEIAKELGIECEYRKLKAYDISQYPVGEKGYEADMKELREEAELQRKVGIETTFDENLAVRGWTGKVDQRGGMVVGNQATFHPTRYLAGVLAWLKKQPNFQCFTHTRVMAVSEKGVEVLGLGHKSVEVKTESGHTVKAENAVEATCVPLQKLSVIIELEFHRTYCIAIRVPKGSVEDCLLYDNAEAYKYVRLTECDAKDDYMIVGGCDHKVGQEDTRPRFGELEQWTRERFPQAGAVDYKWSGQIFDPVDYMAYIGKNQGNDRVYIVTGDSGDGLTHGVIAGRLIADEIGGVENKWAKLYNPKRLGSVLKSMGSMVMHDLQINAQYKRFLQSDITDIEDLVPGSGGVLNPTKSGPVAVYKDENGKVSTFSALCPHLKGVVCWNQTEKSFDCPVHGSRFSAEGVCLNGPAKANLRTVDEAKEEAEAAAS